MYPMIEMYASSFHESSEIACLRRLIITSLIYLNIIIAAIPVQRRLANNVSTGRVSYVNHPLANRLVNVYGIAY